MNGSHIGTVSRRTNRDLLSPRGNSLQAKRHPLYSVFFILYLAGYPLLYRSCRAWDTDWAFSVSCQQTCTLLYTRHHVRDIDNPQAMLNVVLWPIGSLFLDPRCTLYSAQCTIYIIIQSGRHESWESNNYPLTFNMFEITSFQLSNISTDVNLSIRTMFLNLFLL